jgi:hypothetical protein
MDLLEITVANQFYYVGVCNYRIADIFVTPTFNEMDCKHQHETILQKCFRKDFGTNFNH